MSDLLARAGAFFLAPEPARTTAAVASCAPATDLACVLAPAGLLAAAAGGVAAELRRQARARTAVVATPGAAPVARPATPAASAAARRLAGRELRAVAAGALCRVALPDDPVAAGRDAWRLVGCAGVPVVVGLAARVDALDGLLAQADRLLLAIADGADPALAELALASLTRLGPPTTRISVPGDPLGRRAAALGLRRLGQSGTAVPA